MPKNRKAQLWLVSISLCSLIAGVRGCASPIVLIDEATGMSLLPVARASDWLMRASDWLMRAHGLSMRALGIGTEK